MPARAKTTTRRLALLLALLLLSPRSFASPLPPLVLAAQSANGKWLVTVDFELAPPQDSGGGRRILRTTYHVLSQERFLNSNRDRLDAPGALWSERWFLNRSAADERGARVWPIISDDGQTLVLINMTAPFTKSTVLSIYQEDRLRGRFVRTYVLENLWPAEKIDPKLTDFGYTPQWSAGGHFSFSDDCKDLLYRTQWGTSLTIRLSDGVINPQPASK